MLPLKQLAVLCKLWLLFAKKESFPRERPPPTEIAFNLPLTLTFPIHFSVTFLPSSLSCFSLLQPFLLLPTFPNKLPLPCCMDSSLLEVNYDMTENFLYTNCRSRVAFCQTRDPEMKCTFLSQLLDNVFLLTSQPATKLQHLVCSCPAGTHILVSF